MRSEKPELSLSFYPDKAGQNPENMLNGGAGAGEMEYGRAATGGNGPAGGQNLGQGQKIV